MEEAHQTLISINRNNFQIITLRIHPYDFSIAFKKKIFIKGLRQDSVRIQHSITVLPKL